MNTVSHMVPLLAASLVSAVWQSALVALFIAACIRLLPGVPAGTRSVIWTTAFLLMSLLPFGHIYLGNHSAAADAPRFQVQPGWAFAVVGLWALLSAVRAVQLLYSAFRLYGIAARATAIFPPGGLAALLAASTPNLRFCTSTEVDVPSVAGFFRPRILIPATLLSTLSPADLHQIVLHELEHLRRRDDWTNLLQKLGVALFPLNPVLLWVERRLCLERELACDDHVLRASGSKAYAICLVNLAQHGLLRRGLSLALGAWERQSELSRRVHRILRSPQVSARAIHPAALATCLAAVTLGTGFLAVGAPQLITFSEGPSVAEAAPAPRLPAFHPTLTRATMPSTNSAPRTLRVVASHHRRRQPGPDRTANFPRARQRRLNPSIVLIDWQPTSTRPRWRLVQQPSFVYTYAALPTGSGWLVFQL